MFEFVCAFVRYCVFRHVYNLLSMVLLTSLMWNFRYLPNHPLAISPDAPSSNWDTEITSPSPRMHSWLPVGRCWQGQASSSSAVPLQLVFCHPSPEGPGCLQSNLFISKSEWSSYKAIYHWIYWLMENIILSYIYTNSLEKRQKWISIFMFFVQQKWIHHL